MASATVAATADSLTMAVEEAAAVAAALSEATVEVTVEVEVTVPRACATLTRRASAIVDPLVASLTVTKHLTE